MILQRANLANRRVIILLAPDFAEGATIYCLDRLREAGIAVSLVAVSAGLISGAHGVAVRPDYTLEQLTAVTPPSLVIIPDGKKSVTALLADPRVHRLLAATLDNDGLIAAMPIAASVLGSIGGKQRAAEFPIITQSDDNLDGFSDRLINLVIS